MQRYTAVPPNLRSNCSGTHPPTYLKIRGYSSPPPSFAPNGPGVAWGLRGGLPPFWWKSAKARGGQGLQSASHWPAMLPPSRLARRMPRSLQHSRWLLACFHSHPVALGMGHRWDTSPPPPSFPSKAVRGSNGGGMREDGRGDAL